MKRLILMRHAKSDWSFSEPDKSRPLNKRGVKSAQLLGDWLRTKAYLPDEALVSTSTRTRETWALLGLDAPVRFEDRLYHAEPEAMLEVLKSATGEVVLMLGHNTGISDFAQALVARAPDHEGFDFYPTCATLVADFDLASWQDLEPGQGQALDFVVPRELG